MSCIKDHVIQKYIDGETTPEETLNIKEHVIHCTSCALKIDARRKFATRVKNALNLLSDDLLAIPAIRTKQIPLKKHLLTGKFLAYAISSACILFLVLIFTYKEDLRHKDQVYIIHTVGPEYDANRPITDQEIIINVIDSEGKVLEY